MQLDTLRERIDVIDEELVKLFCERMKVSEEIGEYKRLNGMDVLDVDREAKKIETVRKMAGDDYCDEVEDLFRQIMVISRRMQESTINEK